MNKTIAALLYLVLMQACTNGNKTSQNRKPGFAFDKNFYIVNQPIFITGILRDAIDSSVLKRNTIKQFICYIEHEEISFLSPSKKEWRMYSSCTFDTTGNWVEYKSYDHFSIANNVLSTELKNSDNVNVKINGSWKGDEYYYKTDSVYYYAKYNVRNDTGYLIYDSTVLKYKGDSGTYVSIYNADTITYKSEKQEPYQVVNTRNEKGQIVQMQSIDKRGVYEVIRYEYLNDFVSKSIRQSLTDMTESVYIDIVEYNDMMLPMNYKCFALDNGKNVIPEYNAGTKKANKIREIKVEWVK